MSELLTEALRWYNMPWTILLGIVALYWVIAAIGIIDLDFLDFDFDLDADADIDLDADAGGSDSSMIGNFLKFLQLGEVPIMIVFSFITTFAWVFSLLGNYYLNPGNNAIVGVLISASSTVPTVLITGIAMRPFAMLYGYLEEKSDGNETMIGRACIVRTDRVDEHFGQAEVSTPEGPLIINVRICEGSEMLKHSDSALIISQNKEHMFYTVCKNESETLTI